MRTSVGALNRRIRRDGERTAVGEERVPEQIARIIGHEDLDRGSRREIRRRVEVDGRAAAGDRDRAFDEHAVLRHVQRSATVAASSGLLTNSVTSVPAGIPVRSAAASGSAAGRIRPTIRC